MKLYRIHNWNGFFENNRTRELKRLEWVPMPNKMDGDGYTELLDHKNGASHFAVWVALVEIASRCEPRGTLSRSLPQAGAGQVKVPHDSASLSRISRIPRSIFDEAIPRLISIGWVESQTIVDMDVTEIPQEGAALGSQEGAALPRAHASGMEGNGSEVKGREQKDITAADAAFDRFWQAFPKLRRTKKAKARSAWNRMTKTTAPEIIIAAAIEYAESPVAQGRFVQGPEPWLNGACWDDDRTAWQRKDETNGKPKNHDGAGQRHDPQATIGWQQ